MEENKRHFLITHLFHSHDCTSSVGITGDNDGADDIGENTASSGAGQNNGSQTHKRRIYVKVLRNTGTNTVNHLVLIGFI